MTKMGLRERFYGWLAGRLIVRTSKLAYDRRDIHEYNHLLAAIKAGNSQPCATDPSNCSLLKEIRGVSEHDAESAWTQREVLRSALAWLVKLKQGPRDEEYEKSKPVAWANAREMLAHTWTTGDPCGKCGSRDTYGPPGGCRACGASDADE